MEGKINIKNTLLYSIIALAAAGSVLVMLSTIFGLIFRFFIKVMEIDPNVLIQQQQLIEVASHVIALGIYFIVYKLIFRKDNKIQDEGVKVKKMGLCAMMGIANEVTALAFMKWPRLEIRARLSHTPTFPNQM